MLIQLTHEGEDYMRDLSERDGSFVIGPSPDFDILLYLFRDHLDEQVIDTQIGFDLKILREDLDKSLDRLENKKYIVKIKNRHEHKIYNVKVTKRER